MARRRPPRERRTDPPDAQGAFEVAARFLGTRPRTRWELERRLRRAGVEEGVMESTIERLADLGYLDDAAFARWWGEQRDRHNPRGRRMVEAELRQRGVPREVIEEYREEHAAPDRAPEDGTLPSNEPERASQALERHLRGRPLPEDRKALERIGMYLMRRGFDAGTARAAIRAAGAASDDESTEGA